MSQGTFQKSLEAKSPERLSSPTVFPVKPVLQFSRKPASTAAWPCGCSPRQAPGDGLSQQWKIRTYPVWAALNPLWPHLILGGGGVRREGVVLWATHHGTWGLLQTLHSNYSWWGLGDLGFEPRLAAHKESTQSAAIALAST